MYLLQFLESMQHHFLDIKEVPKMVCLSNLTEQAAKEARREPTSPRKHQNSTTKHKSKSSLKVPWATSINGTYKVLKILDKECIGFKCKKSFILE